MTGKQIEETLERNAKNIGDGFDSEVLKYINRLKSEIKRIQKNWDIAISVQRAKWQKKVEQTRTGTAKEILSELLIELNLSLNAISNALQEAKNKGKVLGYESTFAYQTEFDRVNYIIKQVKNIATQNGVEVDNE